MAPIPSSKFFSKALELAVLSWTPYSKLKSASSPDDYEKILSRLLEELKFHIDSLFTILFFMATEYEIHGYTHISWTVACLLFTLFIHAILDATSGEALHDWLSYFPFGRHLLAFMAKLPAFAVIATIFTLALTKWSSIFTFVVCCIILFALLLIIAVRLNAHHGVKAGVKAMKWFVLWTFGCYRRNRGGGIKVFEADLEKGVVKMVDMVVGPVVALPAPAHYA